MNTQSQNAHTPGPWIATPTSMTGAVWAGDEFIASVFPNAPEGWDGFSEYEGLHEMRANAQLIAAAPELLEALKVLSQEADSFNVSGVYFSEKCMGHKGLDMAYAALEKAGAA